MPLDRVVVCSLVSLALLVLAGCDAGDEQQPAAAPNPVEADPHLWLEEVDGSDALAWVRKQNKRSLGILESDPRFDEMYSQALSVLTSKARIPYGQIHGGFVYNFWQDEAHVRGIWRRAPLAGYSTGEPQWQTLLDVDALDEAEQQNWVWKGYTCLPPAWERCLLQLSRGGTDASVYREFSIAEGDFVAGGFEVPQAKSSVAWVDADTLLVGTDWGDGLTESGLALTLKSWRRGAPMGEAKPLYTGKVTDVGVFPLVYRDGETVHRFAVRARTFFEIEYLLLGNDDSLTPLPLPSLSSVQGLLNGRLIATLEEDWSHAQQRFASGSLVALRLADLTAELVYAPQPGEAINGVGVSDQSVFVELLDNVVGKLRRVRRIDDAWQVSDIDMPQNGVVEITSVNDSGDDLLVSYESLTVPDTLYYVGADDRLSTVQALPAQYDASNVVVEQRTAVSADGTEIPYFVAAERAVLERGNAPTVQYAYGGFQIPTLPRYYDDAARPQHGALAGRLWLSRGGVLVLANIRGGGEFGPAWHQAALLHNRHKAFEDFFAVSEALIADGVTSPQRLGAIGRSNGGLLMGVALTQRPELYAAIDCGVPLLDMLRYHKLLAGASWMGEYGNPDMPADREVLEGYSPYQHMAEDEDYPAVFFYTSTRDDRVHPGHARKMAARMEQFGHGFLYYENIEGGHGGTANQTQLAHRNALEYLFFLRELSQ